MLKFNPTTGRFDQIAPPPIAETVPFTPAGSLAATDVQAALEELDTEKAAAASVPVKATGTEINTGTDDAKFATAKAIADSDVAFLSDIPAVPVRVVTLKPIAEGTALTTGDGKMYFVVPQELNGLNLTAVGAHVFTVSSSGLPTIQINNKTDNVDMLSTRITIDANELDSKDATDAAVIDTAHDDVATGDEIRIDVDVAGTGTKGLEIRLSFS